MPSSEADQTIDIAFDPCTPTHVQPGSGTTLDELAAIDEALSIWTSVSSVRLARQPTSGGQTIPIHFENASLVFRGLYQDEIGEVVINRRLRDFDQQAITIAHELGHAMGLPHIDDRPSVMNSGNIAVLPTADDIDALGELWGTCVQQAMGPP